MPNGQISIIVPTYNVAAYLPEYLESLTRQKAALRDVELIFVDDGSPDDSVAIIRTWAERVAPHTQILSKPNGGLASARNAGLEIATGTWVTFNDPDDRLSSNYLDEVSTFLSSRDAEGVALVACRLLILEEETGRVTDTHPLRAKFAEGRRIVDLNQNSRTIHMQAASAFLRRETLDRLGLRFDDAIRPNFEDSFLISLYLSSFDQPRIALLPEAHYEYRRRSDGSSLVQASWQKPEKYTVLPKVGYLRLLETVHAQRGHVPEWLQNLVLYDLFFYFRTDIQLNSTTASVPTEVTDEFHRTLEQIATYLDPEVIDGYKVAWTNREMRQALLLGAKKDRSRPRVASLSKLDPGRRLVRVSYYFTGTLPDEQFFVNGREVQPIHRKIRSVVFLNKVMMYERIAWLPGTATITLRVDGNPVTLRAWGGHDALYLARPPYYWQSLAKRSAPGEKSLAGSRSAVRERGAAVAAVATKYYRIVRDNPDLPGIRLRDALVRQVARRPKTRERYGKAWLLLDRDSQAQDNAEHLYRYLRESQPDVNAWFVLSRDSSDWDRLEREGFRLIPYGTREYYLALTQCEQLISSQVDHYVVAPFSRHSLGNPRWRFTFLQHGVTKDDLSRWVNPKPIDLFLTVTPDEQELIVGDYTPYAMTTLESVMTGFPRHDRLLRLSQDESSAAARTLLVMPTWRRELLGETIAGGNDRALRADFWDTEYARAWRDFLESDRLRALCERAGWQLTFVPHPNMQDYLDTSPLPPHVAVHRFRAIDVQEIIAAGAAMVTDYSSLAFEMAYIKRPVVYYQFDQAAFFSGAHAYRKGAWSYENNGFGPVTETLDGALDAIAELVERGGLDPEYAARMDKTFPLRDGKCCERTYQAITRLRRPMPEGEVVRPVQR